MKRTQLNASQKTLLDMMGICGSQLLRQSFCGDIRFMVYIGAKWHADVNDQDVAKLQKLNALRESGNGWVLTNEALRITR